MEDALPARLRGFGPLGIIAILIILASGNVFFGNFVLPLGGILVLAWVHLSQTPWRDVGYVRPKSWMASVAIGIVFGATFKLVMKAIVMPLLGADPINHAYHYLAGNTAILPAFVYAVIAGAGFGEETVFRGYMFERLGKIVGSGALAKTAIVLITSTLFGAAHHAVQGMPGVQQATIVGLVFGMIFAVTGRIFMLMVAHAAFDIVAIAIVQTDPHGPVTAGLLEME